MNTRKWLFTPIALPLLLLSLLLLPGLSTASEHYYRVNPGDILSLHIRNEQTLSVPEVRVRPDGYISVPVIGEVLVGGHSIPDISARISEKLQAFLRDEPIVTVALFNMSGNIIYVLGKVNRPGQFTLHAITDITQALALAGGLSTFADADGIKVLRRNQQGEQSAIPFNYSAVKKGRQLDKNIILKSGDVVLVP